MKYLVPDTALRTHRKDLGRATWAGIAAFAWGILFAAAHVYWACGGTALITADQVREAQTQLDRDPRGYVVSWTILSALFVFMGSFPLALAWPQGNRIQRLWLQMTSVLLGYLGMTALAIYGLAAQEYALVVFAVAASALGGGVACVRPRERPVFQWLAMVATWTMGGVMIVYGIAYVAVAIGELGSERFIVYLVTGGASWLSGGVLFVMTAWSVTRVNQPQR